MPRHEGRPPIDPSTPDQFGQPNESCVLLDQVQGYRITVGNTSTTLALSQKEIKHSDLPLELKERVLSLDSNKNGGVDITVQHSASNEDKAKFYCAIRALKANNNFINEKEPIITWIEY